MTAAHRNGDSRSCGAKTIVTGQSFVFVNGKLWAVEGDKCDHGNGDLVSSSSGKVRINGKKAIVIGDTGTAMDDLLHSSPEDDPSEGSSSVFANGG